VVAGGKVSTGLLPTCRKPDMRDPLRLRDSRPWKKQGWRTQQFNNAFSGNVA